MLKQGGIVAAVSFLGKILAVPALLVSLAHATPASAQPAPPPDPPGLTRGTGTHFELPNSPYLPVTLDSDVVVTLTLSSVPEIVDLMVAADPATGIARFTVGGFAPNTLYYRNSDNGRNEETFYTDGDGSFFYYQDLTTSHHVWFRDRPSTYYLYNDSTGGDCSLGVDPIGIWNATFLTCSLIRPVSASIFIGNDGITLDGNGKSLTSDNYFGVLSDTFSNVTIKNLSVSNAAIGIWMANGNNLKVTDVTISGGSYGIYAGNTASANNSLYITNNVINDSGGAGIYSEFQGRVTIEHNTISSVVQPNYANGIRSWNYLGSDLLTENVVSGFSYGIYEDSPNNLRVTYNTVSGCDLGLYITASSNNPNVYNNNFIGNTKHIQKDGSVGIAINPDTPFGGNYYDDFDTEAEGCYDNLPTSSNPLIPSGDGFCDAPYNTGTAAQDIRPWTMQDGWSGGPVNEPPTADAGGPYDGDEGSAIDLYSSASDPEGDPLTYTWTVTSAPCSFDDYQLPNPTLTCSDDGVFTVTLEVSDGNTTVSDTATVNVANVAPIVATPSASPEPSVVGQSVTVSAQFSDPGSNDTHPTCNVNYGDSSGNLVGSFDGRKCTGPPHVYELPGEYTVTVSVTDDSGATGSNTSTHGVNNRIDQTITFGPLSGRTYGDASFTVSATGGGSGNPVVLNSRTATTCSATGNDSAEVTILAAGTCAITASQAGNEIYNPAYAESSFTISPAGQTITFNALSDKTYGDASFDVSATSSSGLAVTFTSQTETTCSATGTNGATITILAAGNCTITASQAGNTNYNSATDEDRSFNIGRRAATWTTNASSKTYGSGDPNPLTSGSGDFLAADGVNATYNRAAGENVGSYAITATLSALRAGALDNYTITNAGASFTISPANQTINFGTLSGKTNGDAPFTVSATGGGSGNPVTFSSLTEATCSATGTNGATVTILAVGTCTIRASQAGDINYYPATYVDQSFQIAAAADKGNQTITFVAPSDITYGDDPFTVSATGGGSGNPVTFSSQTTTNCTTTGTNGATVTILAAGNCTIRASQEGNANFNPAPDVQQTFTIGKAGSTVTVTCDPESVIYSGTAQTPCTASVTGAGALTGSPTMSYAGNTNVGTATASAIYTGDDNHTGSSDAATFTIDKWTLSGFYQPVEMTIAGTTVWNTVKNGSTVPLKFEVFAGSTELTDVASVKSFTSAQVACTSGTEAAIEEVVTTTGGTELRYDTTSGQFINNWKTPRNAGMCYRVTMTTQDNSSLIAYFKLK